MLEAYRRKLPGKRRALRFEMTASGASLQVQDSAELAKVVTYDYEGGELRGPSPVELAGVLADPNLDDNLFDWDQVAVELLPALVEAAPTRTKLARDSVVQVKIMRQAPSSDEMGRRIGLEVEARIRAMKQKFRRLEQGRMRRAKPEDAKPEDAKDTDRRVLAPLGVEISILLQSPEGFGWLTADASGRVTSSGVDPNEKGPQVTVEEKDLPRPYWRRAAGLHP